MREERPSHPFIVRTFGRDKIVRNHNCENLQEAVNLGFREANKRALYTKVEILMVMVTLKPE